MTQLYVPAYALVTLGTLKTSSIETDIPLGLRILNVIMSGIFLVMQEISNRPPSLTVILGKSGCLRTGNKNVKLKRSVSA